MAIATEQWNPSPSRTAAKQCPIGNDEWLKSIGAITLRDDDTYAFTNQDVVRELEDWFAARDVLTNAPWNLRERLRRRVAARWSFTAIWGPTVRNFVLRPKSWRPSTVCALVAVMGVDLIEGSHRMAGWRGVVDERLS
jgi:hypothetical protein